LRLGRAARVVAGLQFVPRMRAPTGLVVVAGLVLGWSTAQAAPAQGTSRHNKATRPVEVAPPTPADDTADADDGTAAHTEGSPVMYTSMRAEIATRLRHDRGVGS